jgi:Low iron-inducible periplasmic protein
MFISLHLPLQSDTRHKEAVKKGAAFMNTAMYVIRELEDALDDCAAKDATRNDDAVHALDEAVAFYTGSLEGTDGAGSGVQMYALAEKRCVDFKTCGTNGDQVEGKAFINNVIFKQFDIMQQNLDMGLCAEARRNKEEIETNMFVPLVQGTLRYAWKKANEPSAGEKEEAEGAAFAAAVLPVLARCSENDADIVFNSMKPGSGNDIDFLEVKHTFERNYDCMGIVCNDVGGLYDDANEMYYVGAAPCGHSNKHTTPNVAAIVGSIVGVLAVGLIFFFIKRRRSSGDVEFKSSEQTTTTV